MALQLIALAALLFGITYVTWFLVDALLGLGRHGLEGTGVPNIRDGAHPRLWPLRLTAPLIFLVVMLDGLWNLALGTQLDAVRFGAIGVVIVAVAWALWLVRTANSARQK